ATTTLAWFEPFADLRAAVLFESNPHLAAPEHHGLILDPHAGDVAVADDGCDRHCRRAVALAGGDPEGGEHLRLERALGIGDFRAHHHAAGSDIGGGADRRDARLEQAIRQGRHLDLDVLADANHGSATGANGVLTVAWEKNCVAARVAHDITLPC